MLALCVSPKQLSETFSTLSENSTSLCLKFFVLYAHKYIWVHVCGLCYEKCSPLPLE